VVLLTLQLGGCTVDLMSEQASLRSLFCTAAPGDGPIEIVVFVAWAVLAFSWIVGLTSLRIAALRPAYWALLLAIAPAWLTQSALLERDILFCDGP
jgi:hypothetical protein